MRISSTKSPLNSEPSPGRIEPMSNKITLLFFAATLILLLVIGFLVLKPKINLPKIKLPSASLSSPEGGKTSGYQAVFLSNGQVYFGKLSGFNSASPVLKDVYYLRVGTVLEPGQAGKSGEVNVEPEKNQKGGKASETTPSATRTTLTLIKLGQEIHGPQDEISLNKDQILFVENLRIDSKVVEAIKRYQESLKK